MFSPVAWRARAATFERPARLSGSVQTLSVHSVRGGAGHRARSHRFRDTFAVELLLQGVPLERVSVLLGHSSIRVTERHYAPWVKARQEQAEADVRRTWQADPMLLAEGYNPGTTQ